MAIITVAQEFEQHPPRFYIIMSLSSVYQLPSFDTKTSKELKKRVTVDLRVILLFDLSQILLVTYLDSTNYKDMYYQERKKQKSLIE